MKHFKAIRLDYDRLNEGDTALYELTSQQVSALLAMCTYLGWSTRWTVPPPSSPIAFRAATEFALMNPIDFCALMVNCIENNAGVRAAITQYLTESGNLPTGTSTSAPATQEEVLTGLPCSQDDLYGQIVAIVDFVQEVANDIVETVSGAANDQLAIARLVDVLPILGDLPVIDDLGEIAQWITDAGPLSYAAGWTVTTRQDIICAMWESSCQDCNLTTEDIVQAYRTGGGFTFNINDIYHIIIGVILGTTGDKAFAVGVNAAVAYALSVGQEVLGFVGLPGLRTIAATGTPSGDHALFCNPCANTFCRNFYGGNGNVANEASVIQYPNGTFPAAVYANQELQAQQPPLNGSRLFAAIEFDLTNGEITDIDITADWRATRNRNNSPEFEAFVLDDAGNVIASDARSGINTDNTTTSVFSNLNTSAYASIRVVIYASQDVKGDSAYANVTALQVQGTGSPDFGGTPC